MLGMNCSNLILRIPAIRRAISTSLPMCYAIVVKMPALSPTMTEGTIVSWSKKEGDEITAGDGLCEIQTDKAMMTMEFEEEGILAKILKAEGSMNVSVGEPIALIAEDGEDWSSLSLPAEAAAVEKSPALGRESRDSEFPPLRDLARLRFGPAVRLLLQLYRIQPTDIDISGPHHRLLKGDVLAHIAANELKPLPPETSPPPSVASEPRIPVVKAMPPRAAAAAPAFAPVEGLSHTDRPATGAEASAAQKCGLSKRSIPHNYVSVEVTLDHVLEVAARAKLPVTPYILKAVAVALRAVPEANSFLHDDGVTVVPNPVIDIAVVSSVHSNSAPCLLRSLDCMTCADIAQRLGTPPAQNEQPRDMEATFSVIDLTDSSLSHLSGIIAPSQAAVLAIGGISASLSPVLDAAKLTRKACVTLSADTRVLDQVLAARFLTAFAAAVEMAVVAVPAGSTRDPFDQLLGLDTD